jgi:type 1 fimbriae regulatory protein FimB
MGNRDDGADEQRHLTGREMEKLLAVVKGARHEVRDRCLLLLMFRHGLRVSEALGLTLGQVDIEGRVLHVARLKGGLSTTHPLRVEEVRTIKAWLAERRKLAPEGARPVTAAAPAAAARSPPARLRRQRQGQLRRRAGSAIEIPLAHLAAGLA